MSRKFVILIIPVSVLSLELENRFIARDGPK
jgi:hypothetical protein